MVNVSCCARARVRACLLIVGVCGFQAAAAADETAELSLPLKRVVLFSSGVGFYEHRGTIDGQARVTFSLKTADINDLLKSLVVQDFGGGFVTAVHYASPEPIGRTLQGFTVDLNAAPSLAQIFSQLRGQPVEVEAPARIVGTVVGVETRTMTAGVTTMSVQVLNLRTEEGLVSVRIDTIGRTRLLDAKVDQEFQQALDLLAGSRQNEQKSIKLRFDGEGQRDVAAGYIQESPVWKTTYRLVLSDDEQPFMQGWAIVENTTGQPWRDVQLTLVSGRPISFLMDLYEPLYAPRPMVMPERYGSLQPRVYEQDLSGKGEAAMDAFAGGRASNNAATGGGMGGYAGEMRAGGLGGMVGGGMGGMGGGMMGDGAAGRRGRTSRPFVTTAEAEKIAAASWDPAKGVASVASGEELGELFRYVITSPVKLERNESAMLPIVNDAVKGEKLVIYNAAVHAKHPLSGLRLTNSTDIHWMQGPITLYDGGEYAGDARIEDIPPGATRLVSYALDLQTEVAVEEHEAKSELVKLSIRKGGLQVSSRDTREVEYVVKNAGSRAKKMLIERPLDGNWKPVHPEPVEETRSLFRFTVEVPAGKTQRLAVTEHKDERTEFTITALKPEDLNAYLDLEVATPAFKQALEEVIKRKTALLELAAQRAATERTMTEIGTDQLRLRANLQSLSGLQTNDPFGAPEARVSRSLLQRYVTKLDEQETELEKLRLRVQELKEEEGRATRSLENFLQELDVDGER